MVLAVPKESWPGERRVAATPETVTKLVGMGFEVRVETQAGLAAAFVQGIVASDPFQKSIIKAAAPVTTDVARQ